MIATDQIMAGLCKVIVSYMRTPRHAAAALYRTWTYVQPRRDIWPETPHWFRVVLRNELHRQHEEMRAPAMPAARAEQPSSEPDRELTAAIATVAAAKGMR